MKLSLRGKLLLTLILVPGLSLAFFAVRAINLMAEDKKAYVFDSAVIIAKSLAIQTRIELDFFDSLAKPISDLVDPTTVKFGKDAYRLFREQNRIEHVYLFQKAPSGAYVLSDQMYLPTGTMKGFTPGGETLEALIHAADETGFAVQDVPDVKRYFLIATKLSNSLKEKSIISLAVYNAPDLYEAYAAPSAYRSYLVTKTNFLAMEPKFVRKRKWREQIASAEFFKPIFNNRFPIGTAEIKGSNGDAMLVSFAEVGRSSLLAASVVEKGVALGAVKKLIFESTLVLLALFGIMILISIAASFRLTSALQQLVSATKQIASGKYNVKVDLKSEDEVGELASSVTLMAEEILRSITRTAENARLTNELNTVKLVQEMMFPHSGGTFGSVEVAGHFLPATECGGDWYHYSPSGQDRLFIWIGDVTGHGASAALITAAAKAVSSVIEVMPDVTPGMALKVLNHAIASTSKGQVLMTFAIYSIDLNTGLVTYAVASHEPAFVLPVKDELKKSHFLPLCGEVGPRLGETLDAEYAEAQHQLEPGDMLFAYTDGLADLTNAKGQALGEREMIKLIGRSFSTSIPLKEKK